MRGSRISVPHLRPASPCRISVPQRKGRHRYFCFGPEETAPELARGRQTQAVQAGVLPHSFLFFKHLCGDLTEL